METEEHKRIAESSNDNVPRWQKWGPYVSERSWGTVREDYSANGDAWNYFPFEDAHKKPYRWGEDGIAGWCDRYQVLVFSPVFWNGRDPILKERLFGLNPLQGNHGEDVKEYYFYLDGTPTYSYMKYLYKYPQAEFPYQRLKDENAKRGVSEAEFELVHTGVFDSNRYFDIFIEYAKASPDDICIRIEAFNRGPDDAPLHILPHLWFRNQWSWGEEKAPVPQISELTSESETICLVADDTNLLSPSSLAFDYHLGHYHLYGPATGQALFTNNEYGEKDAFHRAMIFKENSLNPEKIGTKACLHYFFEKVPAGGSVVLHLRLTLQPKEAPLTDVDQIIKQRKIEADRFYEQVHPKNANEQECKIQRQAFAGILWNMQIYLFDINLWLDGDNPAFPPPESRLNVRNYRWRHLNSMRIMSMPDKWEFPWFAAWDLAFHTVTLGLIDIELAKEQIWLLLFDQFQHPNGSIPAYEWEFSELNPPIQAWAALRLYNMEKESTGREDREFLRKCFLKLLLNFVWWVNRLDSSGLNVFEGGFLGLDNIAIIDRSLESETGVVLRQSDGTGWMALFCLNLMRMALELAKKDASGYEPLATKFFQHFAYIAHAMKKRGNIHYEMWSEHDGFFYDALSYPNGSFSKFRVRSLVGLIPLHAIEIITEKELSLFPEFTKNFRWFLEKRKDLVEDCISVVEGSYVLSLVNEKQLKSILSYVWSREEFRADFGLRSLSKFHKDKPFYFKNSKLDYEPGYSLNKLKGGNSNWRGPVWMPTTYLLIESLKKFSKVYGKKIQIEVEGEQPVDLDSIAQGFIERVMKIFLPDENGLRPFWGKEFPFAKDPYWEPYLLFYEYYHADTGEGLGASHQTGWSALIANMIKEYFDTKGVNL